MNTLTSRRLLSGLLAVVVSALVLSGCKFDGAYDLPLPGGHQVSESDGYTVTADFADVLNVVPKSPVMVDDVAVGQVLSVSRVGWHARVQMRIRKDIDLPDNAVADIQQTSLLGEKYVALEKPPVGVAATGRLGNGDHIPMARTGRNPEVEEVLGALSFLLSGGGIEQLKTISNELNTMMQGRTGQFRDVLGQLNTLVGTLNSQKGDIIRALESVNSLSHTLVGEKKTIGDALDAMGPALGVLNQQHTQIVAMLRELDHLGSVGTRVVNSTKDDLIAQLRHLEPVMARLADADNDLVPGVTAMLSYPFPITAADTIKGDFANVIFRMQIKLTPVSEGGLIPTNLQELSQVCKSLPLAPICVQTDPAIAQLCKVLGSLPLCAQSGTAKLEASRALRRTGGSSSTTAPASPLAPLLGTPSPSPTATPVAPSSGSPGGLGGLLGLLLGGGR